MSKERTLLLTLVGIAIAGLVMLLWGMPRLLAIASLASEGKEVIAKVLSHSTESCGRRYGRGVCEVHMLAADGHTFRLTLTEPHAAGSDVQVTYLPADPTIIIDGHRSQPLWKLVWLRYYHQSDEVVWPLLGLLTLLTVAITFIVRPEVRLALARLVHHETRR